MSKNHRLALSRVNLRDSLVVTDTAQLFVENLHQFAQADPKDGPALESACFDMVEEAYGMFGSRDREDRKPFVYHDGVAIIPIHGALLNRFAYSWGFVTGYQAIRRQMNAALEDEDVEMIVFDVDSPGGELAGCFELADEIRASREIKPSLAVVDLLAASAGYALASAATQMVATPSSKIGSIGVYRMHVDVSGALDQAGIKITFIEAPEGGMKTAGNGFEPLSERARKDAQASVNKTYDDFVELVVANRGMADTEIRDTEARVFRADEALALRLIDAVKTPSEAVSSFLAELADDDPTEEEGDEMTTKTNKQNGSEVTSEAPKGDAATAPAAPAQPDQAAIQAALKEDRERMSAIKALPEAAKRPKLADKLALDGLSVDQAKGILEAAAEETPAVAEAPKGDDNATDTTNHFENAMDKDKHPEVGAGAEKGGKGGDQSQAPEDLSAAILADQGAAVGRNYGARTQ